MYAHQESSRTTGQMATEPVQRPKHAESAIIGLQHVIEQLEASVSSFIGKVNPILIQPAPLKEGGESGTAANMSNIAETISSYKRSLERVLAVVEDASSRVDI